MGYQLGERSKGILDKYVAIMDSGESVDRYSLEAEFEQTDKRYKDPQRVELLLKKAANEGNTKYKRLFNALYGDQLKHNGGFSQ